MTIPVPPLRGVEHQGCSRRGALKRTGAQATSQRRIAGSGGPPRPGQQRASPLGTTLSSGNLGEGYTLEAGIRRTRGPQGEVFTPLWPGCLGFGRRRVQIWWLLSATLQVIFVLNTIISPSVCSLGTNKMLAIWSNMKGQHTFL